MNIYRFFCMSHFLSVLLIGQFWKKTGRLRPIRRLFYAILSAMSIAWRGSTHALLKFYLVWPPEQIFQTVFEEFLSEESTRENRTNFQTLSEKPQPTGTILHTITRQSDNLKPFSWSLAAISASSADRSGYASELIKDPLQFSWYEEIDAGQLEDHVLFCDYFHGIKY